MNLSDVSEPQRQQAAEWVCREFNVHEVVSPKFLQSLDWAMKAVEKLPSVCSLRFAYPRAQALSPSSCRYQVTLQWDRRMANLAYLSIGFDDFEERPAAITLCCAIALGFKVEGKK